MNVTLKGQLPTEKFTVKDAIGGELLSVGVAVEDPLSSQAINAMIIKKLSREILKYLMMLAPFND